MIRGATLTETVTLFNDEASPSDESVFGDPEYDPAAGVEVPAFVSPLDATEDEVNRDVRINRYSVLFELDAPVDGLSELEWQGDRYQVIGEPRRFSDYRGGHSFEAQIRKVEG